MKERTHSCGELRKANVGVQVGLAGWVSSIRHHGKVAFINLRDRYGIIQILIKNDKLLDKIRELEGIELKDEEIKSRLMENEEWRRMGYDRAVRELKKNGLYDLLVEEFRREKVLDFLRNQAEIKKK